MAKLDYKDIYSKLGKRTEWYALAVRDTFQKRIGEIVAMCEELDINEDKPFAFADYKDVAPAVQAKLRQLYSEVYQSLRGNIVREWNYANDTTDKLVKGLFGKHSIEDKHYARYFQRNKEAMNSFFERRQDGLNLSQRVWQYVGQAKTDLEVALDLGIGQGLSSDTLNCKVKQYLNNPDDLFRRFRYKVGEDEEGNPIYGRKWKRRRYDKETDTFYWVDDNPKDYHTGQGVYRSSYKNAMRLARTETNMAYRTADITRWQQMEFVLGYEVKLSHNHPCTDICDDLQGKYPKEFVFKGWHPHCYCYIVPILCKDNELEQLTEAILNGEDTSTFAPAGMITDVPAGFTGWIADNEERIRNAASLPYFITDNYKNGEIGKGFKWLREHKNEAGLANFKKVLANKELELEAISKVQPLTAKEFAECSNYVEAGKAGGFPICTTPPATGVQFEELSRLADKEELAAIMQEAAKGNNTLSTYINTKELAELEKIATQAKFAAKTEAQFVAVLDNDALGAVINGDTSLFAGSRYIGTNYSKLCSVALENGSVAANTGATCVIKLPAGSRYLQTAIGGEQTAMLLPNTKLKVTGKEIKAITHAGKTTNITHYTLEVVNDGSSFVKSIAEIKTQVESEVTAYKKAVKAANNVINAANKGHYNLLGVDTAPLQAIVKSEGSAEISKATKVLAKEMAGAKKQLVSAYSDIIEDPLKLYKEHGLEALDKVYNSVKSKIASWEADYHFAGSDKWKWFKKKVEFEINYVEQKKAYSTWKYAQGAYKKLLAKVENKVALENIQEDIDKALQFVSKSSKVQGIQAELQSLVNAQVLDMSAINEKLVQVKKEIERLEKERLKSLQKNLKVMGALDFDAASFTQARKDAALWAKTPEEADKHIRTYFGKVWQALSEDEKQALFYYTHTYCPINEPLRGLQYYGDYAKLKEAQKHTAHLRSAMQKAQIPLDMWTQRGEFYNIFEHTFGIDLNAITALTQKEVKALSTDKLLAVLSKSQLGTIEDMVKKGMIDTKSAKYRQIVEGFIDDEKRKTLGAQKHIGVIGQDGAPKSMGDSKGAGFSNKPIIYNIYMPKGTKCFYLEPFSLFGNGVCSAAWDGISTQKTFGYEAEILLQMQTKLRITKIEWNAAQGRWYVDAEVIGHTI